MKIYTLIEVSYDWYGFEMLVDVSGDLTSLLKSQHIVDGIPVFSNDEVIDDDFEPPSSDGLSHYYWMEWTV